MAQIVVPKRTYVLVWFALMVLTVVTAGVSFVDLGEWSGVVALLIASTKALLVALFFMHLKYVHQRMAWIMALAGVFWIGVLLLLTVNDYVTRNFLPIPGK